MLFKLSDYQNEKKFDFRRRKSPYETCRVSLHGLDPDSSYEFSDKDTGEKYIRSGRELMSSFSLSIEKVAESKLLIYKKI